MVSFEQFTREIRNFDNRREVLNEIRRDMRKPLPALRRSVRAQALATLPSTGGLGAWVAKARMTVQLRDRGRTAGLRIKLSRKASDGDKADLTGLDEYGRLRHPLYGDRNHWFGQTVTKGFFTRPWIRSRPIWLEMADGALDRALDKIRRG